MRRPSILGVALAATLAAAGCTPPGVTVSEGPTATQIAGRFDGVAQGDAGCAWVETDDGDRVELFYPDGWRVEFDPLAVFDENGVRRVEAGQEVFVDGSFGEVGASMCEADQAFIVTDLAAQP